ncbi:MAG: InlB B-repeat-containing protein [Bacilli bacterium]|nr:InlB B-repeat-containing protein [Bacilli bacterium]
MMRFRIRRISPKVLMVLAILILGIFINVGYAYLSQDLTIGGLAIASKNVWGIRFLDNSIVEDVTHLDSCENNEECARVLQPPTVGQDGKSISFGITFHEIDDYYEFTVDVINNGTIDAMLNEVIKEGLTGNSNYLDFTVTYSDGMPIAQYDQLLKNGGTEKIKVKVKCKSELQNDLNTNLGVTVNYIKANNNMQSRSYDPETMIRSLNTLGTSIADDDPDHNLRFIGANPDNYVWFNNQKWRIIGVFDGRLKLIQESIGNYAWDTSKRDVNDSWGVNQWGPNNSGYTGADLMKLLNPGYETNTDLKCNKKVELSFSDMSYNCGNNSDSQYSTGLVNNSLYWNATSGLCYTFANYDVSSCDFTSTGLSDANSKSMIDNVTWYLGSTDASENLITTGTATASLLYNAERSNNGGKQCDSGKNCTDTVERTTRWQGKVGLMYPSDYAYATGGGNAYNRNDCLTNYVGGYSTDYIGWGNTYAECGDNDWLGSEDNNFTIAPYSFTEGAYSVIDVNGKYVRTSMASSRVDGVRPTVYLKTNVVFTNEGNGKQATPFVLRDLSDVHTVTFDANGGAIEPTSKQVDSGSNIGTLPTPIAPTGKTFDGWYTAVSGGTKITSSYTPTANVTVYAHWLQVYDPETRIRALNTLNTSIADDDPDNNLRFIGADPDNYVSFNNQTWRIIGVFDGRLKIVQDSIGNYTFDSASLTTNSGNGINVWGQTTYKSDGSIYNGSDLMKLLNPGYETNTDLKCVGTISGDNCGSNSNDDYETDSVNNSLYWNASSGLCYTNANYQTSSCDFSSTGLQTTSAKNMIENHTWNLGSNPASADLISIFVVTVPATANNLYNIERSNNIGNGCDYDANFCMDGLNGITTWQGKVGLMYPSDYAYATAGGNTYSRSTCLGMHNANYSGRDTWKDYTDCRDNDWLFNSDSDAWSFTPRAGQTFSDSILTINKYGYISTGLAKSSLSVRPTVYLKTSVKIVGSGTGTQGNPFKLKIIE